MEKEKSLHSQLDCLKCKKMNVTVYYSNCWRCMHCHSFLRESGEASLHDNDDD